MLTGRPAEGSIVQLVPEKAIRIRWIRTSVPDLNDVEREILNERAGYIRAEQRALMYKLLAAVRTDFGGAQYPRELHPRAWAEMEALREEVLIPHRFPARSQIAVTAAAWAVLYENVIDCVGSRVRTTLMGPIVSVLGDEHYWGIDL